MIFNSIVKALSFVWIFITIIMYITFAMSIVGVVYGAITGSPLTELWSQE